MTNKTSSSARRSTDATINTDADADSEAVRLNPEPTMDPVSNTSDVRLDWDRQKRCGFPEAIFGEGKSFTQLREILTQQLQARQPVLITRIAAEDAQALTQIFDVHYNPVARTISSFSLTDRSADTPSESDLVGYVPVVAAGTTDLSVAEEATETLRWMGVRSNKLMDVGVAGPHRLVENIDFLNNADAIVVVAGMEGALPSVVAGYVDCPVIAVPTSVGYGANFGGISALLSMLNSCAANVSVVNIDAGFKGGYVAGMIASQTRRRDR